MQAFEYLSPTSLEQAVALLARDPDRARPYAGGTDLLPQMREGRRQVGLVVDVKAVPELSGVSFDATQGLRIGAATSCYQICHDTVVVEHYPGLVDGFHVIGAVQIQYRASVGGNLCNASPAADSIPALIVHGATCELVGPDGSRTIPVEAFCVAPGRNALRAGELLVAIHIPPPPERSGASYLRFIPRNEMDIAVVGAAAAVTLTADGGAFESARLALGAVGPTPLLAGEAGDFLAGKPVGPKTIAESARLAQSVARPIDDVRGTADFRRHLSGVLMRRAIEQAVERAKA